MRTATIAEGKIAMTRQKWIGENQQPTSPTHPIVQCHIFGRSKRSRLRHNYAIEPVDRIGLHSVERLDVKSLFDKVADPVPAV